ncbi:hypothetical protein [Candidatus Epulonipiscium viviparus]|uniref:hypothetical protein n=1 Tax=Candidatus Epulonipiscium viviparus TaxID=420336 RepID=UPI0027380A74|nr:hypothetical protein [Candidatus Epulopiscium viviparus]
MELKFTATLLGLISVFYSTLTLITSDPSVLLQRLSFANHVNLICLGILGLLIAIDNLANKHKLLAIISTILSGVIFIIELFLILY